MLFIDIVAGSQHVRAALASVIMGLAPVVGKPATIGTEHSYVFTPRCVSMLRAHTVPLQPRKLFPILYHCMFQFAFVGPPSYSASALYNKMRHRRRKP